MPVMGGCPYCNALMAMVEVPPNAPGWFRDTCDACGKTVWRWLTRINPQAWKEEDFLAQYEVDDVKHEIKTREGKTDTVQEEYDREAPAFAAAIGLKWPPTGKLPGEEGFAEEVAGVSRLAVHHHPEITEGGLEDLPAEEALGDPRVQPKSE